MADQNLLPKKSYFEVLGLCCASEVTLLERIMGQLNGVKEISIILPTKTLIVLHDSLLSDTQIVEVLNKARLEASVRPKLGDENLRNKWPAPSVIACGVLLALSFLKFIYRPFHWLALGAVVVGAPPIVMRGFASIRNLTLNVNILVLLAVVGTLVLQDYWEAGTIIFLFSIAQWLETRASYKAMAAMSALTSMAPQKATIAETGEQVDVEFVKLDTVLGVKAGEAIPIDGVVVEGKCEVDEKMLTGESFPVAKESGSAVWAGAINLNGYITVRTTALAKDCVVARMAKLVEEAHQKKSQTERFIDNCAKYYIPMVMIISASVAVIPAVLRVPNENYWFHLALVVLVSACPCALVISTPVTIFCGLSKAATAGLLIKGGDYLELLAKVKTIAFDKTGTLTRGEFSVISFQSISEEVSFNTLLYWVSSIESKSSHPMAAALVGHGLSHSIEPNPESVEEFQTFPGEGVYGTIDGKDIYIGNWRIGLRAGCKRDSLEAQSVNGETTGYIYCGAALVGMFRLSDTCRSGAAKAIVELKALGIRSVMLTGDSNAAALCAYDQLDGALDTVHAELLPEDKAQFIKEFKKDGPTAMIGDGINDALALATADIGISMGISGSALAMETGNVILMSNDIQKIPNVIQLAKRAFRKLVENVIISVGTKSVILALAFAGYPLVWAAVLTDVGTCLVVILNSMLLLKDTRKHDGGFSRSGYGTFSTSSCERDGSMKNQVNEEYGYNRGYVLLKTENSEKKCCLKVTCKRTTKVTDLNSVNTESTSSRGKEKIVESSCRQGEDSDGACKVKQFTDECCGKVTKVTSSNTSCSKQIAYQPNYKGKESDGTTGNCLECCLQNRSAPSDGTRCVNNGKSSKNKEIGGCCKQREKQCSWEVGKLESGVKTSIAATNLKKSDIVEYCKQYGENCCGRYEQHDTSSGGSLLNIVIE